MKRVWHPYTEWEDYRAGMYGLSGDFNAERLASIALLSNPAGLRDAMADAAFSWPIAAEQHLTDTGSNRRAWLGQAACCFAHGATQFATCAGWWELTEDQRIEANACADDVVAQWEMEVIYGAQTLFAG